MKRATIAIPDELDEALAAYGRDRGVGDDVEAAATAALRAFLEEHGYIVPPRPFRPFRIRPVPHDGCETDISLNHDHYFADGETSGSR